MQVTIAPGQDVGNTDQEFNPSTEVRVFDQKADRQSEGKADSVKDGGVYGPNKDSSTSVIARTKPLISRTMATDGTNLRLAERPTLRKKPNVLTHIHFNTTRFVPKGRKVGSGPLTKSHVGEKKKTAIVPRKPKPVSRKVGDKTASLPVREPSIEAPSSETRNDTIPATILGTGSETDRRSSLEKLPEQPNGGMAGPEHDTASMSSEPTGTVQSQDKKCMNKIKVTHFRLPLKEKGHGCRGNGTVLVNKMDLGSSEKDDMPPVRQSDPHYSPDPLHKLLTDTFNSLNITTFSVHLSEPSNLPVDAKTGTKQILNGLKPLSSFSSSSPSSSSSQISHSSSSQLSVAPPSSSQSVSSQVSFSSTIAPSQTDLIPTSASSLPSTPLPPSSPLSVSMSSLSSSSKTDQSDSVGLGKLVDENSKITTTVSPPKARQLQLPRESGVPLFRQTSPKRGYVRHPLTKFGSFQNKTHQNFRNLRIPHQFPRRLNIVPRGETETRRGSTNEFASLPSSSASEEPSLVEVNAPVEGAGEDEVNTPASFGVEQKQKKLPTERRKIPIRLLPTKGGYFRRPFSSVGPLNNRTRSNLRLLTHPSRSLNLKTETQKEHVAYTELPATLSPPVSKDFYSVEGSQPVQKEKEDTYGTKISFTSLSSGLNQTLRGSGMPSPHRPTTKVGYFRRAQQYGGPLKNKTHLNLSPFQHPHRGLIRKPLPHTKINQGSSVTAGSPHTRLRIDHIPEIPAEQDVPGSTQEIKIRQSEETETADEILSGQMDRHNTTTRPQTNELEKWGKALVQTNKSEEETSNPDSKSDSDIKKERGDAGNTNQVGTTIKQSSSDSKASRPITLPKKRLPTRITTTQHQTQVKHYISGSQRGEDAKINHTARRGFDSKTGQTGNAASKPVKGPHVSSTGIVREPLDYVGVTNQTSHGFTLVWDSPERKYKNFVVTTKEVVKIKEPKQKEGRKDFKDGNGQVTGTHQPTGNRGSDENRLPESVPTHIPRKQSSTTVKAATENDKTLTKVVPGSARSLKFEDLFPQTEYTVTLLGKGPGVLSRLHKLVISTGTSHWYSRAR